MKPQEIRALAKDRKALGQDFIVLSFKAPKNPGIRVRFAGIPGAPLGTLNCINNQDQAVATFKIRDLLRWMDRKGL